MPGVMGSRVIQTLPTFLLLLTSWWLHLARDRSGLRSIEALKLLIPSVGSAETGYRAAADRRATDLEAAAGSTRAKPATLTSTLRNYTIGMEKANAEASASEWVAKKKTVRYWTRAATPWTPPDLTIFPDSGIVNDKWRPLYDPTRYHVNSLMVVQFEWHRLGERWGYAPLGPWCGLCQTLKKGCRKECQELCGEHCEGLGKEKFTDEIGCTFCGKDDGYGCRKYAECRNNCRDCTRYTPFVDRTSTDFHWGPLRRDLFGKEARAFPDAEADAPWSNWGNPVVYDRTPTRVKAG